MHFGMIVQGFLDILYAPYYFPEMFWIALPLMITLIVVELYLGKYDGEQLLGHTSLTNSLVFVFVGLDLIRKLLSEEMFSFYNIKSILAVSILFIGLVLMLETYYHKMPKIFSRIFTSFLFVNVAAYLVIVAVYGEYAINIIYLINSLVFMGFFFLLFGLIRLFEPKKHDFQ